jgi:nucleoside-diphosphate-sugar epimerase
MVEEEAGRKLELIRNEQKKSDLPYNVLDIAKALGTGWKPAIKLRDGIWELYHRTKDEAAG